MKKIFAIFTLTALIAALSGCSANQLPRYPDLKRLDDMGPIIYNGSENSETFLVGLDGKKLNANEIKYLKDKDGKPTNTLDENNFGHAECIGFGYAFKPGVYFDGENAPEKFKDGGYIGEELGRSSEFFRVNAGDKFGDLTVHYARCIFSQIPGEEPRYEGSEIWFTGEITLRGRIDIPSQDPKYPTVVLDMNFQGDPENALPVSAGFSYDPESGYIHSPNSTWQTYTDVPGIRLGRYIDYDIDFDGLSEGDIGAEVEITITNIVITYGIQGYLGDPTAKLTSVKRL